MYILFGNKLVRNDDKNINAFINLKEVCWFSYNVYETRRFLKQYVAANEPADLGDAKTPRSHRVLI